MITITKTDEPRCGNDQYVVAHRQRGPREVRALRGAYNFSAAGIAAILYLVAGLVS